MIVQEQERQLLNGGLTGQFNAAITKLMLANHGYGERQTIDHTSSDNSMGQAPVFNIQPVRTLTELDKQEFEQIAKEVLAIV